MMKYGLSLQTGTMNLWMLRKSEMSLTVETQFNRTLPLTSLAKKTENKQKKLSLPECSVRPTNPHNPLAERP